MEQVFPDSPGVIYRLLAADSEFQGYVGSYKFANGQIEDAISLLTPGSKIPSLETVTGVECIIHEISDIKRMDFVNDESKFIKNWKVFLVAWDPANGQDVEQAATRIMELFRGATCQQTIRTSEGSTARVQTVVTIPSDMPLDVEGMAVYGPQPTITINTNLPYVGPGTTVNLSWVISSADSATMDNGIGSISLTDNEDVVVDKTTTFTINASSEFTSASAGIEIVVFDPVVSSFSSTTTGNPNEYIISWTTSHAQEIKFLGRYDWPLNGSTTVTVNTETVFELEAISTQSSTTASLTITP